jgi:DNA (cytosine-5)-methyltransferase 1
MNRHKTLSLFSGAMGLDIGLEKAGFDISSCVENDSDCVKTIHKNRPNLQVYDDDIEDLDTEEISLNEDQLFAIVGGPPCQSFSPGGLRKSIRDRRGSLFAEFIRFVDELRPKYFLFENVSNIITAAVKHRPIKERPGQNWNLSKYDEKNNPDGEKEPLKPEEKSGSALEVILSAFEELDYHLSFGVLNAADFGVPQKRLRFFLIGSRSGGRVPLPERTHSEFPNLTPNDTEPWRTVGDAIKGLDLDSPTHSEYTDEYKKYFDQVPEGRNWRDMPEELAKEALGEKTYNAGGGKTGYFRRLSWDEPAPTITGRVNRKSSAMCHPEKNRPLSVRECAELQQFPKHWDFSGSMSAQYRQIGNAVPIGLAESIGKSIVRHHNDDSFFSDKSTYRMLKEAHEQMKLASTNKKSKESAAKQSLIF